MEKRWLKYGGLAGLLYPLLQMASQGFFQAGGIEPAFTAEAAEIVAFFESRNALYVDIGGFLAVLSVLFFVWFAAALWGTFRQTHEIAAMAILAFGAIAASMLMSSGGWGLAMFRIDQDLDPQLARMLFDEGNLNFANLWVMLGGMVLSAGAAMRAGSRFRGWIGTGSLVLGVGLIVARTIWTSQAAFAPYVLFWIWMIYLGLTIYRRGNDDY